MNQKTQFTLVALTFVGMVGLYVGLYYAYQKYQDYKAKGGTITGVLSLLGGSGGS